MFIDSKINRALTTRLILGHCCLERQTLPSKYLVLNVFHAFEFGCTLHTFSKCDRKMITFNSDGDEVFDRRFLVMSPICFLPTQFRSKTALTLSLMC